MNIIKPPSQRKVLFAALFLFGILAAYCYFIHGHGDLPPPPAAARLAISESTTTSSEDAKAEKTAGSSVETAPDTLPPNLADQVDALVKVGSPDAMYAAFKILRKCKLAREDDLYKATRAAMNGPKGMDSAKACGNITGGQMSSMSQYLKAAAFAGVHGAARSVADEGPAGNGPNPDLPQDDPTVVEYNQAVEAAVDAGAKNGDWWSLTSASQRAELGTHGQPDFSEALNKYIESDLAFRRETGHDFKNYEENVARLKYYMAHPHYGEESHSFSNQTNTLK